MWVPGKLRLARFLGNRELQDPRWVIRQTRVARPAADPATAFVTAGGAELEQILCIEEARTIGRDNTIVLDKVRLQVPKQPGHSTCAGLAVPARRHLDGSHSIWWGRRRMGRFDPRGRVRNEAPGATA